MSMERKSIKPIIYTICFACIMWIDWCRGSQRGDCWATYINLTGVVMSVIMLSHFSFKNVPLKRYIVWLLIWLAGSGVGYMIWRIYPGEVFETQYATAALSIGCLGLVVLHLWQARDTLKSASLGNPVLLAVWVILSVLMLLSRRNELWPIWFLWMFGMFYLIPFTKEEKKSLWEGAANGIILGFFMIQIFAYGFRPYDEVRYKGAYDNCNVNAMMYLVTLIMTLYKLHSMRWQEEPKGSKKVWKERLFYCFYTILAAGLVSFILFTMTRTALLVALGILLVYGFLEAFVYQKRKWWKHLLRVTVCVACVVLTVPFVYVTIRYLPTILHHPMWWGAEYSEDKVHSFDPYDSEKYVSWEEAAREMLGRFYTGGEEVALEDEEGAAYDGEAGENMAGDAVNPASQDSELPALSDPAETDGVKSDAAESDAAETDGVKSDAAESDSAETEAVESDTVEEEAAEPENADEVSPVSDPVTKDAWNLLTEEERVLLSGAESGSSMRIRLEIYKRYINHLNLTGHTLKEGYFPITENYHAWHAQNVFLQIAFYHGIPAGICFVILIIGLGLQALKLAFGGRRREDILPLLILLFFVGYGMLECVWYLGQTVLFMMYLVPKILIDGRTKVGE